jgi:hypothetical protein
MSGRFAGFEERLLRIGQLWIAADRDRPAGAVGVVVEVLVVLKAPEGREYVVERPPGAARSSPSVVVVAVPAQRHDAVDRRTATDDPSGVHRH